MKHYSHLATATNILWQLVEANGHNPAELYQRVGIDPEILNKPGARIPSSLVNRLWAGAAEIIADPCFGLKSHKYWHPSYFHALGYAWLASHTLRDALNRFVRYLRIVSEKIFLTLEDVPDGLKLVLSYKILGMRVPAQIDMGMAMSVHICRLNFGDNLKPVAVSFMHPEPPCTEDYFALFKAPVQFSADRDSITFSKPDVDRYLMGANPQLARLNDQVMIEYLNKLDKDDIINRVAATVVDMLPSGGVADEKVAKTLNMSVRSLQRRLKEVGTTFRTILEEVRKDLATTYVHDPAIELAEVAFLLGFSDQSAFSRAYRRWTGNSPSMDRKSG